MRCSNCGRDFSAGLSSCPHCGAAVHYGGNTEFYDKAARSNLTVKDLFSGVFAKHPKGAGAKMFMAGTPLSTPSPDRMLAEWQKPWLFVRVLAVGLVFGLLCYILADMGYGAGVYSLFSLCALIVPVSILVFFWEVNIPRDIPLYTVLGVFLIGGVLSVLFINLFGQQSIGNGPAYLAAFTEEPAKVLATAIFIYLLNTRYIFGGMLIGAAVGTGFACIENIAYVMDSLGSGGGLSVLIARSILSPGGHIMWACIEGGAMCLAKGSSRLSPKHIADKRFLVYLAGTVAMHALWNSDIFLMSIPVFIDLKYLLLCAGAILVMFTLLKQAVQQVLTVTDTARFTAPSEAGAPLPRLHILTGPMADMNITLDRAITIGRDPAVCNLVAPWEAKDVSRRHCVLEKRADGVYIMDLGSTYGTFLMGGQRIPPNVWMKVTGTVWLGKSVAFTIL